MLSNIMVRRHPVLMARIVQGNFARITIHKVNFACQSLPNNQVRQFSYKQE